MTNPAPSPSKLVIVGEWLAQETDACTCDASSLDGYYGHREGCGLEPLIKLNEIEPLVRRGQGLDDLRAALVRRADLCKALADALRGRTETELVHSQYVRARMLRVAYFEAIKLVDELRTTGAIADAEIGGSDGLVDLIRAEQQEREQGRG